LTAAANGDDVLAMSELALCRFKGYGAERDLAQAVALCRRGAEAGDGLAMARLGSCYAEGQGVERDLDQASQWYTRGAEIGNADAVAGLRRVRAVNALLGRAAEAETGDADWVRRLSAVSRPMTWADAPPLSGSWHDLSAPQARALANRLASAFDTAGFGTDADGIKFQSIRQMPLPFYADCALLDVQLQRNAEEVPVLASALVSPTGAALLDGGSSAQFLPAINPVLLQLTNDETITTYLRFFCTFFRGEEGPFQIVEKPLAIPFRDGVADCGSGWMVGRRA
jgi:TPR repeat protein